MQYNESRYARRTVLCYHSICHPLRLLTPIIKTKNKTKTNININTNKENTTNNINNNTELTNKERERNIKEEMN